jgi:hypothetical protein
MHLHEVLRLWRDAIVDGSPQVALSEDDARELPAEAASQLPRETIPGDLRRDDRSGFPALLAPAEHRPNRGASFETLELLERRLGFVLPDPLELILRLHDGGDFFAPTLEGLPPPVDQPLHLFSAREIASAYGELVDGIRAALEKLDPSDDDLFRLARRFGAPKEEAAAFAEQLGRVAGGWDRGLEIIPLTRPAGSENLVCLVPPAGKEGRVGCAFAASGFLPDHSDEYPFEKLEGWLVAVVKSRACRRSVLT